MAGCHSNDDIAVIGLGCRFPGDAESPSAFFDMLLKRRDAWKVTPSERFNVDSFYHPSAGRQGSTVVRGGYYLKEDVALFDAPVRTTSLPYNNLLTKVVL
jgi:acyl transferase domain-containing protein